MNNWKVIFCLPVKEEKDTYKELSKEQAADILRGRMDMALAGTPFERKHSA